MVISIKKETFFKENKLLIDQFPKRTKALLSVVDNEERKKYYYKKILKLTKSDPNCEYWVELRYYLCNVTERDTNIRGDYLDNDLLISNKGRIYNLITNNLIDGHENKRGYLIYSKPGYTIIIHRAVACSFIPLTGKHLELGYDQLECNHINAKKNDPSLTNLEWTTPAQNKLHAKENNLLINHKHLLHGLSIPMRGTVIDIPGFNKRVLYVCGKEECESIGVSNKVLYKIRTGVSKTYKGCSWEEVSKEEYIRNYKEYDPDLIEAIKNYSYNRNGRKSARADKVIWELTHIKTKAMTRLSGTIELANFGTNYSDLNKSYKNNGKYKNYLIKKIHPQTTQFPR